MKPLEYFHRLSETARSYERMGKRDEAQQVRNRRNEGWDRGVKSCVRFQQELRRAK